MTTPNGNIIFNASTGSDTHASGLGPAIAVTLDITTAAGSSTAPVSAFPAGSGIGDLVYIPSATGRKFNIIAGAHQQAGLMFFDEPWDDSLTDAPAYIGGKRATLDNADSRRLTSGESPQTWIELETDQTITSAITGASGKFARIKSSAGSKKTISISGVGEAMFADGQIYLRDLKFRALDGNNVCDTSNTAHLSLALRMRGCVLGDPDYPFTEIKNGGAAVHFIFENSVIQNINNNGLIAPINNFQFIYMNNCIMKDCGKISLSGPGSNLGYLKNSIFIGDGTTDFFGHNYGRFESINCIFYNYVQGFDGGQWQFKLRNCIFHTVSDPISDIYGRDPVTAAAYLDNVYYYNASSPTTVDAIDEITPIVTLTEDPFIDVEGGDFNLNDRPGGGAVIKALKKEL